MGLFADLQLQASDMVAAQSSPLAVAAPAPVPPLPVPTASAPAPSALARFFAGLNLGGLGPDGTQVTGADGATYIVAPHYTDSYSHGEFGDVYMGPGSLDRYAVAKAGDPYWGTDLYNPDGSFSQHAAYNGDNGLIMLAPIAAAIGGEYLFTEGLGGGAAAGGAAPGFTFNAAADSQLANVAIDAAAGPGTALAGYTSAEAMTYGLPTSLESMGIADTVATSAAPSLSGTPAAGTAAGGSGLSLPTLSQLGQAASVAGTIGKMFGLGGSAPGAGSPGPVHDFGPGLAPSAYRSGAAGAAGAGAGSSSSLLIGAGLLVAVVALLVTQ